MNDEAGMSKRRGRKAGLFRDSSFCIRHFLASALIFLFTAHLFAVEVIPPTPDKYFNDYAKIIDPGTAQQLNSQLEQFEKDTSNQIVVAIFPKMQSDDAVDSYTVRVARAWDVGQKERENGAVLFVFVQDHKIFIATAKGLQGAIPDITCKRIVDDEIAPPFKKGDFNAGITAGVNALMAAAKGEYKGTGTTVREEKDERTQNIINICVFVLIIGIFLLAHLRRRTGSSYGSSGGWYFGGFGSGSGGGGGGFSGGGGGFSGGGGGGGFDGGGAGGSW